MTTKQIADSIEYSIEQKADGATIEATTTTDGHYDHSLTTLKIDEVDGDEHVTHFITTMDATQAHEVEMYLSELEQAGYIKLN